MSDAIPSLESLAVPIPPEEQEALLKKVKYEYDSYQRAVANLHKQVDRWHELYEGRKKSEKKFPWPGASNYSVPLIMSIVDGIHARIVKAVFEVDPIWICRPRASGSVQAAYKAQWYLDYWADEMELDKKMDVLIHNMCIEGTGVIKVDWVRRERPIPISGHPEGPARGQSRVVEYEGPDIYYVPLKDFVLIPADSPTIDDAVYVGHRVYRTAEQLKRAAESGFYFNVDKLLESSSGDTTFSRNAHPSGLVEGLAPGSQTQETRVYEIVELYGPYDFGDGPQPALIVFNPSHSVLLRLEPYPYDYGKPHYIDFKIYPRPNFFWGRSVPEILEDLQEELIALHNMRSDAITRRIAPPILRMVGSRWNPSNQPWAPGQVIDVTDPGEIRELPLAEVPSSAFVHENTLMAFVERVTGMSDYFMGRSPSQNRTATEVNRVTSEGLARLDVAITRFQNSMRSLAWMLWWLLYQFRPYVDYFHADNQDMTITKAEMRPSPNGLMPFEFVPQGRLSDASKEARRQQLLFLSQILFNQLSSFYPDGIQYLLDKLLREFDIQDRGNILGPPWQLIRQQLQQAYQQGLQDGAAQVASAAGAVNPN